MSEKATMGDQLERHLRLWMRGQVIEGGEERLLGAVAAGTRELRQRRGPWARLHRAAGPGRSEPRPAWQAALRFALLVGLAVATVAGAILLGAGAGPSDLRTSTGDMELYPRIPDELPANVESGSYESPIGPVRWVHVVGDLDSWPVDLRPVPGPAGLLALDRGGSHPECEVVLEERLNPDGSGSTKVEDCRSRPGVWSSNDGLRWSRHRTPVRDASELDAAAGSYWLRAGDPPALLRSTDGVEWAEVDLSSLAPPAPAALDWTFELGRPVASGDRVVVPVAWRASGIDRLLGLPRKTLVVLEASDAGRYTIRRRRDERVLGSVRAEETATGLRLSDAASGRIIGELDGVGMDFIDRWAAQDLILEQRLAVIDGTSLTQVTLPGEHPRLPEEGMDIGGVEVLGGPDGFRAYARTPDRHVRVWHSPDGLRWQEGGLLSVGDGPTEVIEFQANQDPGQDPVVVVYTDEGVWESRDAATWQRSEVEPDGDRAQRVPSGWIAFGYGRPWVRSLDGEWGPLVDPSSVAIASNDGYDGRVGDTILINELRRVDGAPRQDLWIVQVDTEPAG